MSAIKIGDETVLEIIREYLEENGWTGLAGEHDSEPCECTLDNFMHCDSSDLLLCRPCIQQEPPQSAMSMFNPASVAIIGQGLSFKHQPEEVEPEPDSQSSDPDDSEEENK